jgi:soluble lytic murein transglycosylase-like protein
LVALLVAAGCGAGHGRPAHGASVAPVAGAPAPDAVLPASPRPLAERLSAVDAALARAILDWRMHGHPARGTPPGEVTLDALYLQRGLRLLSRHPRLAAATVRRLPACLARETREVTTALRDLRRLSSGWPPHRVRTGPPEPVGVLLRHYHAAQRRFGVGWHVLAAVNLVESAFGRLRNASVAGARGPMQFMPATWRVYGLGGNINDPRDAILGAANFLRHAGAPRSYARALYAYNPSSLYVDAVRRYARLIARERNVVYFLYSWQVFVRTRHGERRVTGPGT